MLLLRIAGMLALLCFAAVAAAEAEERITSFVSDVTVERNGDLIVAEQIGVQSEARQIRHGILRDFPTTYTRSDGSRVEVGFDVRAVTLDGSPEPYTTERLSNGVRVRIGDANTTIAPGPHEFGLSYRTTRQIGFFADYDELYWNATGTGWTFPIASAEARITLPEAVPFRRHAIYTGPQGAHGTDAVVVEERPGHIVFRTTRLLPPRNGLTVAASWAKGVVAPPTSTQQLGWLVRDNPALIGAGLGVLAMIYYVLAWLKVGRDPPRGTIVPLFGPPDGMSAAAVRYVEREGSDERTFTAAILDLAVNGHLKLVGAGKKTTQIMHCAGGRAVDPAEQAVEQKLFATKSTIELDRSDHDPLLKAKSVMAAALAKAYSGRLFNNNFRWSFPGFIASAGIVTAICYSFTVAYDPDRAALLNIATTIPAFLIAAGSLMLRAGRHRFRGGWWLTIAGLVVVLLSAGIGLLLLAAVPGSIVAIIPVVVAYLLAPFAVLGFGWLKAATPEGRAIMDRIEGFRQYLGVAEEARLEALNPPEKTPELFERFLPYAVALDVQNTWAKRFAGVLATAASTAAVAQWYSGGYSLRDPVSFADHLGSDLSRTIASASTAPGSGGGGGFGGGSSGGGGGGGGGSGW